MDCAVIVTGLWRDLINAQELKACKVGGTLCLLKGPERRIRSNFRRAQSDEASTCDACAIAFSAPLGVCQLLPPLLAAAD